MELQGQKLICNAAFYIAITKFQISALYKNKYAKIKGTYSAEANLV